MATVFIYICLNIAFSMMEPKHIVPSPFIERYEISDLCKRIRRITKQVGQ